MSGDCNERETAGPETPDMQSTREDVHLAVVDLDAGGHWTYRGLFRALADLVSPRRPRH